MTPPSALTKGMVAVSADSGVKPLGYIVWYSVPDKPVSLKDLRVRWIMAGLDGSCMPNDPRSLYQFKRSMRAQQGRVKMPDGHVIETDVRDVHEDAEVCIYQISRVVKDEENRVVEYPKAMRVTFDKAEEEPRFLALGGVGMDEVTPMEGAITDYLRKNAKKIEGRRVRTIVRKFLREDNDEQGEVSGLSGENLRGKAGGVYFVAAKFKRELDAVAEVLGDLFPDNTAYLYTVPLADGASERELIRRHHVTNTKREIDEAIADVRNLLREDRKNAVRSDVKDHWFRKLRALQRREVQYAELLKGEQAEIKDDQEMLRIQLEKLL